MIYYGTDPPTSPNTSLLGARTVNLKHDAPPPRQVPLPVSRTDGPTQGANEVGKQIVCRVGCCPRRFHAFIMGDGQKI
jgi:hypothetical protein